MTFISWQIRCCIVDINVNSIWEESPGFSNCLPYFCVFLYFSAYRNIFDCFIIETVTLPSLLCIYRSLFPICMQQTESLLSMERVNCISAMYKILEFWTEAFSRKGLLAVQWVLVSIQSLKVVFVSNNVQITVIESFSRTLFYWFSYCWSNKSWGFLQKSRFIERSIYS